MNIKKVALAVATMAVGIQAWSGTVHISGHAVPSRTIPIEYCAEDDDCWVGSVEDNRFWRDALWSR